MSTRMYNNSAKMCTKCTKSTVETVTPPVTDMCTIYVLRCTKMCTNMYTVQQFKMY